MKTISLHVLQTITMKDFFLNKILKLHNVLHVLSAKSQILPLNEENET